jgi:hypothetical protein
LEGNGRFEFLIVVPGKLCERPLRSICDGRDSFRYDRWAPEGDIGELFSPILNPETKLAISLRLRGRPAGTMSSFSGFRTASWLCPGWIAFD